MSVDPPSGSACPRHASQQHAIAGVIVLKDTVARAQAFQSTPSLPQYTVRMVPGARGTTLSGTLYHAGFSQATHMNANVALMRQPLFALLPGLPTHIDLNGETHVNLAERNEIVMHGSKSSWQSETVLSLSVKVERIKETSKNPQLSHDLEIALT